MTIDTYRLQRLEQMGLGPVWALRAPSQAIGPESSATDTAHEPELAQVVQRTVAIANASTSTGTSASTTESGIAGMDWDTLEATIRQCTQCGLCQARTHAVPGVGDRKARWLFVGEGPGRNEDLQGEPFVGPAGKLLDNMLRALGMARGENTYIANIVKCRPVGADGRDRPPAPDEVAACMPYLQRQIALIQPDVIIALGKTAAVSLLGLSEDTALASLRGKLHSHAGIPLVVTYHPAYLLRKPADKAKSWQDLCLAQRLYDGRDGRNAH